MSLLKIFDNAENAFRPYMVICFWCLGCKMTHPYRVEKPGQQLTEELKKQWHVLWQWNGSEEKPSFTPSLLCNAHYPEARCHLFVTDGRIHFCEDCHHELKGQVVDMLPIPEDQF